MKLRITMELDTNKSNLDEAYGELFDLLCSKYEYFGFKEMYLKNEKGEVAEEEYA